MGQKDVLLQAIGQVEADSLLDVFEPDGQNLKKLAIHGCKRNDYSCGTGLADVSERHSCGSIALQYAGPIIPKGEISDVSKRTGAKLHLIIFEHGITAGSMP